MGFIAPRLGCILFFSLLCVAGSRGGSHVLASTHDPVYADPPIVPALGSCTDVSLFKQAMFSSYTSFSSNYTPPAVPKRGWGSITLHVTGSVAEVQFDRFGLIEIGGLELQRFTTAEPPVDRTQITWSTTKDVGEYAEHLAKPHIAWLSVPNPTDQTYTGVLVYDVVLKFCDNPTGHVKAGLWGAMTNMLKGSRDAGQKVMTPPSVIPLSTFDFTQSNPWPSITAPWNPVDSTANITFSVSPFVEVPRRLFLNVYASGHGCEEFWYTNAPDWYAKKTQTCGGGAFRQLTILIDGIVAGTVAPFPVLYSGGANPMFWKPVIGIETLDVGPYRLDITPFGGVLADGKAHEVTIRAEHTQNQGVWYLSAALLQYSSSTNVTVSSLVSQYRPPKVSIEQSTSGGDIAAFTTTAKSSLEVSATICEAQECYSYVVQRNSEFWNYNIFDGDLSGTKMEVRERTKTGPEGKESVVDCKFPFNLSLDSAQDSSSFELSGNVTFSRHCNAYMPSHSEHIGMVFVAWANEISSSADYNRTISPQHVNKAENAARGRFVAEVGRSSSLSGLAHLRTTTTGSCYDKEVTGIDGSRAAVTMTGDIRLCNAVLADVGLHFCGTWLCPNMN